MKKHTFFARVILAVAIAAAFHTAAPLGAAPPTWVNITGNLANMPSECGNLTMLSPSPASAAVLAGVALKGLWSNSSGTTWTQLGTGSGSDAIINRPSWIVYDPLDPNVFWESGIYSGGGIYRTTDGGNTFRRLGSISHNDYVSVDFTDPNRQTLLAGGHEAPQTVYKSTNGGQTWTNAGSTLPAGTKFSSNPLALSGLTYVVNAQGWAGTTAGMFRTTDGGATWMQVSTQEPYAPPLVTSSGAIYWASGGGLLKSTDAGVTWTRVGNNLATIHPIELPDGRLATFSGNSIVASADGGSTWSPLGASLPYQPAGLVYSPQRQAFFIWRWDCGNVVPADAIMQMDFAIAGSGPVPPTNLRIVRSE